MQRLCRYASEVMVCDLYDGAFLWISCFVKAIFSRHSSCDMEVMSVGSDGVSHYPTYLIVITICEDGGGMRMMGWCVMDKMPIEIELSFCSDCDCLNDIFF